MKRYFLLLKMYFKYSFMQEMEYKFNFIFGGLFELIWLIMYVILLNVIYSGTESIGGWNKYQVLMLTFHGGLIDALFTFLMVPGLGQLPQLVNSGELDFYLLKPINKRFYLSCRCFSFSQIKNIAINIIGIIFCYIKMDREFTFVNILGYILLSVSGFLIIYSIIFVLMSLSFWVIKIDVVMSVCSEIITIGNKPMSIYPKISQKILIYVIPILVAFNFPIIFLLENNNLLLIFLSFSIAIIWFLLSSMIFHKGLKKYASASS